MERNESDIVRWKKRTWPAKNNGLNERARKAHLVFIPKSLDELREKVTSELCRVRTRPDLLRSFVHATGLEL